MHGRDIGQAENLVIARFDVLGEVSQPGGEAVSSCTPAWPGNIIDELICDIINEVIPKDAPVSIVREEFSCTDICYRPKTIRETAMSLFISKYNFKLFTRINDVSKKHVTMDFKNKRDLFSFVTRENVEFVFYVKFPAISSTSELIRYEIKIIQLVHNLFYKR